MTRALVADYRFDCNSCKASIIARDLEEHELPKGWDSRNHFYLGTQHFCPTCVEKQEIKEVFK